MYEKERVCVLEGDDFFSFEDAIEGLGVAFGRPMLAFGRPTLPLDLQQGDWRVRDLGHEIMAWSGIKSLIETLGGTDIREHEYGDATVYVFNVP